MHQGPHTKELIDAWLDEALSLADRAQKEGEVPVGAVVIDSDGKIIGRGYNLREREQDPISHAEIYAIREAARALGSWRLIGCTLVVTLEPCPMCLAACQQGRLSRVIYGAKDAKGGALSLGYALSEDTRTNHRFPVEYVENVECSAILSRFFKSRRKPPSEPA